tara:strand:- start:7393 stop:7815 length:423 start_codon:yes stop_codon:yes gene_type:complete
MESVKEGFTHPETRVPLRVSASVEIDVSLGSVQIGSLGCEGCSVLLYSLHDQVIVTFKYEDGELSSEQTYDTSEIESYYFTLESSRDLNDKEYYSICLHTLEFGEVALIHIKDFEQASAAVNEINMLKKRYVGLAESILQ